MDLFSLGGFSSDNLIECSFIVGLSESNLKNGQAPYKPECLFSYPAINDKVFNGIIYVYILYNLFYSNHSIASFSDGSYSFIN